MKPETITKQIFKIIPALLLVALSAFLLQGDVGVVRLIWDGEILEITPNADGGILELGEQKLSLVRGETRRVKI